MKPKDYQPKNTAQELTARITARVKQLAQLTDDALQTETMRSFLEACSQFHQYSPNNLMLIMMSFPTATRVAGFRTWQRLNRFVKRGEQGIPILAPCIYKQDPDSDDSPKVLKGFRVVYVFDISQTDGQDLPPVPNWKSPEKRADLDKRLIAFAGSHGIQVKTEALHGETQGTSAGGLITLSPMAGTKTLIHEIAHELLHHGPDRLPDPQLRELEAEAVAYVVASHFGLHDLACPNYLALSQADGNAIMQRLTRIQTIAHLIISAIDPQEAQNE
jgi:hypothetical protein